MLNLLHYDLMFHFASRVFTFLVKVTFCAINFVSSHLNLLPPPPTDYNDQSNIVFLCVFFRPTIMNKSLGTLLRFWSVFQFTYVQPLPSPHKKCWTRVSRIFSTLYRVRGGRTSRKFRKGCTVLKGNREMTEKYEYCSTVPRTFVQDWFGVWLS